MHEIKARIFSNGRETLNGAVSWLFIFISLAFLISLPGAAQSGYSIINPAVTPEYGYEDFTYSAQVAMSDDAASRLGVIAVTKYYMELRIYDQAEILGSFPSDVQTGMKTSTFEFGPYNFENRFGIKETDNATFEFAFYAGGRQVAKTSRIKGPVIKPPAMTGINYEKNPYFFQGIVVSAAFRDLEGLTPPPSCHLQITGPLETAQSRTWATADTHCRASGKSSYSCTISEDLSAYREGGNFTFNLIYNNLKVEPLTFGPYNVSLQPYSPSVEKLTVPKLVDYTNFTIQAFVRDEGVKMVGGTPDGSVASLVISHPQKGEQTYISSEPALAGGSLVYQWTQESIPALFNRSDVQISRAAPFSARVVYKNENWNYQAEKANVSFRVVEEIPKIDLQYPSIVYVRAGESSRQDITATVTFSKGAGDLHIGLSGPNLDINRTIDAVPLGANRYQYKSQIAFDESHVNNNYTLSLSFAHPSLEDGSYSFEDRLISVLPVSVQFQKASVTAATGLWNDSYTYSLLLNSTVIPLDVSLQTYDPCNTEWIDKGTIKAETESSLLNWTLSPFDYECDEMQQQGAKFRFKASFAGRDYVSKPYEGPAFRGGMPVLVSLESDPVVYVSEGGETGSAISAVVQYGAGQAQAALRLPDYGKSFEDTDPGTALGGNRYRYDWSLSFSADDAGKSFNYTIGLQHESLGAEMQIAEGRIYVKPVSISFSDGSVLPARGRWNDSFNYTVKTASSVDAKAVLEIYNPCSREWVERASGTIAPGEGTVNLRAQPFPYRCTEAEGSSASFRFAVLFAGERFVSDVYSGPEIAGGKPELVSLDYTPVLYVTEDAPSYQMIKATIESPLASGTAAINISGPQMSFAEEVKGSSLGGQRYIYAWSVPFSVDNAGNHTLTLSYMHPDIPGGMISFPDQSMTVIKSESKEKEETVQFSSAAVTPINGSAFNRFTYCVDVRSGQKNLDVELFTQEPGSSKWISQGTIPYNESNGTSQWLCWPDVVLDGSEYGTAKFRFSSGSASSEVFLGPEIEQTNLVNATISPDHGSLYQTNPLSGEISRVYMYNITVQFIKLLAADMKEIRLEVYDPSEEEWLYAASQTYDSSKTSMSFKVNFATLFDEPFLGMTRYRVLASGEELGEFPGPNIDVNIRNERYSAEGKNFTYQCEARSSLPKVDVALAFTKNNVNWERGDRRTYESSIQEWKTLKWEKYPKYYAYEFEVLYV